MLFFLRALRLLALILWVGGIAFFAFVVAPVAFHNLPSAHEAGMVVRGSLLVLHRIGIVCGAILIVAALFLRSQSSNKRRISLAWQIVLAAIMLATTLVSQQKVLPAMEKDRASAGGTIEALCYEDPRRIDFERLHVLSERLEGAVLLLGLAVAMLIAGEDRLIEA